MSLIKIDISENIIGRSLKPQYEPIMSDYTLRKSMSANGYGVIAVTGRAHCQRQVAFVIVSPRANYPNYTVF